MIRMPKIDFKPAFLPADTKLFYQTSGSGLFDIYADIPEPIYVPVGKVMTISTGIKLISEYREVYTTNHDSRLVLTMRPRSGLATKGIIIVGEVDEDYREEIKVILFNTMIAPNFVVKPGDRIAQARWTESLCAYGVETKHNIRNGGFGSSGN